MAYWRPYTEDQEQALDLSRPATVERVSPILKLTPPESPVAGPEMYPTYNILYRQAGPVYAEAVYPVLPTYAASTISPVSSHSNELSLSANEDYNTVSLSEDKEYLEFEQDAMRAMAEKNGGSFIGNNPKMKRVVQTQSSQAEDLCYRKQRERNNLAAKASRDRRKLREVRLALQTTFLKKKVAELRARLATRLCSRCCQRRDG